MVEFINPRDKSDIKNCDGDTGIMKVQVLGKVVDGQVLVKDINSGVKYKVSEDSLFDDVELFK